MEYGFLALTLAGCAGSPAWVDPAADDDWSADIASTEHHADLDAQGVADAFSAALANGFPYAMPVISDYTELMTHTDADCPPRVLHRRVPRPRRLHVRRRLPVPRLGRPHRRRHPGLRRRRLVVRHLQRPDRPGGLCHRPP